MPASPSRTLPSALPAASTRDALKEIADGFARESGIEIKVSADDSSTLATQVVSGAPADLFLSANQKWADFVKDKGLAQEVRPLLGNTLVLLVLLKAGAGKESVRRFHDYLRSPRATEVFQKHGFTRPPAD